jgi:hypothetical protein
MSLGWPKETKEDERGEVERMRRKEENQADPLPGGLSRSQKKSLVREHRAHYSPSL